MGRCGGKLGWDPTRFHEYILHSLLPVSSSNSHTLMPLGSSTRTAGLMLAGEATGFVLTITKEENCMSVA